MAAVALVWNVASASAATISVTTTADEFDPAGGGAGCSLREAIQAANTDAAFGGCSAGSGADTIDVPPGTFTLTRTGANEDGNVTGDLDITANVAIVGAGAGLTAIDGNQADRVFEVRGMSVAWSVSDISIQHGGGSSVNGGAIFNAGVLTVTRSTLRDNVGVSGGAVYSAGVVTVDQSIVLGNSATNGGAIYHASGASVSVISSTLRDNVASVAGGGVYLTGLTSPITGSLLILSASTVRENSAASAGGVYLNGSGQIRNVTFSGNSATSGGGLVKASIDAADLTNVTFSGNAASTGGAVLVQSGSPLSFRAVLLDTGTSGANCVGSVTSRGSNISDDASCFFSNGYDQVVTDLVIGPLASNGGPTETHALLEGSPAIDAVRGSCSVDGTMNTQIITVDQRGVGRPADGNGDTVLACDVGAYERPAGVRPTVTQIPDQRTTHDSPTGLIAVRVNDADTPLSDLTLTARSSNQVLVPNANLQFGGSGGNRTLRATPAGGRIGEVRIYVDVSDGSRSSSTMFTLYVTPTHDDPVVAVDDVYYTAVGARLVRPGRGGVLANDVSPDGWPLSVSYNSVPGHGQFTISGDVGFTYTPEPGFLGADTFFYFVTNGVRSTMGTVRIQVTNPGCGPRKPVKVTTAASGGLLHATVTAQDGSGGVDNHLVELRFGAFRNGTVTINGQQVASGSTFTPPANTTQITLVVARVTPGQATTIPLTVVDGCGNWPTFVGGGPGAGF